MVESADMPIHLFVDYTIGPINIDELIIETKQKESVPDKFTSFL